MLILDTGNLLVPLVAIMTRKLFMKVDGSHFKTD